MAAKWKLEPIRNFLNRYWSPVLSLIALGFSIYAISGERLRFQHAQTSRFVDEVNQLDALSAQYPFVTEYSEKVFSSDPNEDTAARCKRLRAKFSTETLERKQIVLLSCEHLANFMDALIMERETLDPGDWNRWWNSFMDNYDENPVLQDFLESRSDWYESRDVLRDKKLRRGYYRNGYFCKGKYKRSPDHQCFK